MFCWKCGKELPKDARFCTSCGTPAVNTDNFVQTDEGEPSEVQADIVIKDNTESLPDHSDTDTTRIEEPETIQEATAPAETAAQTAEPVVETAQPSADNLVIRKNRIVLSDGKINIDGKYYQKKGKRFKKNKGHFEISIASITGTSMFHSHSLRKGIASLLLFVILTGGILVSGGFGLKTWDALNTPYHEDEIKDLEESLSWIQNDSESDISRIDGQIAEAADQMSELEEQIEKYRQGREQELLKQVSSELDLDKLFTEDFFQDAYDQYIADLVTAFEEDELLHSWLYPYYTYAIEKGANPYISENSTMDMWFYEQPGGDSQFVNELTEDWFIKDRSLYDRLEETGRIYVTASDFMNTVLWIPSYVPNDAVFVKAFGGNPNPAKMSVPGWSKADYSNFWSGPEDNYSAAIPVWVRYDMSAEDLDIDWNQLMDEQAYYDAYVKFMNTIAPGLAVYDMVSYYGSDDAYAGMCFDMKGKEASATEIALLYLESHPDAIKGFDLDSMETSYDDKISDAQEQYDQASAQIEKLEKEKKKMTAQAEKETAYQSKLEDLNEQNDSQRASLTNTLYIFGAITGLLLLMALISLITFIHFAKKPRHLFVLELSDSPATAFSTGHCPKKKIEELQKRLP